MKKDISWIYKDCIFCNIVHHQTKAMIIDQNDGALAFLDAFPLRAGHTLVITRSHYSKVQEISPAEIISLFELVAKMSSVLERSLNANATLIAIHNGREAGQEIDHVHVHIVPRSYKDGGAPVHSIFKRRIVLNEAEMKRIMSKIKNEL